MKLARKLTLALIVGITVVLALNGWIRVERLEEIFQSDIRRDAHLMGRALRAAVASIWRTEGQTQALETIEKANARESEVLIRWVWLDAEAAEPFQPGVDRRHLDPVRQGKELVHLGPSPVGEETLFTYVPVFWGRSRPGALELSESLETTRRHLTTSIVQSVVSTIAVALVCALLVMGIGLFFVGRPVRRLVEQARRIGAGDLSTRLVLEQRDEIAELAAEMNVMCDRLAEAKAAVASETAARIETLEQLRHADRLMTVGKLASGLAHELGTPLNVVSGRAKMIASGDVVGEEAADSARVIADQVSRMTRIIRQLLDFARRRDPQKLQSDLRKLVERTFALLAPMAQKRRVEMVIHGDGESAADVDASQMEQVLTNLFVNSIDAMSEGGRLKVGLVTARAKPPADLGGPEAEYVRIEVADEGRGIAPEHLDHVFEPFFTTKGVGEGTGLGLAVAWGLVREHGGWITVQSQVGHGTTFSIYLPAGRSS